MLQPTRLTAGLWYPCGLACSLVILYSKQRSGAGILISRVGHDGAGLGPDARPLGGPPRGVVRGGGGWPTQPRSRRPRTPGGPHQRVLEIRGLRLLHRRLRSGAASRASLAAFLSRACRPRRESRRCSRPARRVSDHRAASSKPQIYLCRLVDLLGSVEVVEGVHLLVVLARPGTHLCVC